MLTTFLRLFSARSLLAVIVVWLPIQIGLGQGVVLSKHGIEIVNLFTLTMVFVGCTGVALALVLQSPTNLWYPITWFLLTFGVYYGFGPLLYYFGPDVTIDYVNTFFPATYLDIQNVNTLILVGLSCVLTSYIGTNIFYPRNKFNRDYGKAGIANCRRELKRIVIIFLLLGVPVKYLIWLPYVFGLTTTVAPGSLSPLASLTTLSLVPIFLLQWAEYRGFRFVLIAIFAIELLMAFASLSKLASLETIIVLLLAAVLTGVKLKRIIVMGFLLGTFYIWFLGPFVSFARVEFRQQGLTSLSDILVAVSEYSDQSAGGPNAQVQGWWARLNYMPPLAFSMYAYDLGREGETLKLIPYVLIPRLIYPEKPTLTTGSDFNYLVTGNPYSQSAPTVFGEAYWNGGWVAVILVSSFMGMIYWGFESYARSRLNLLQLEFLPIIWLGVKAGIQHDGWFTPVAVGAVVFAFVFHFLIAFFVTPLLSRRGTLYEFAPITIQHSMSELGSIQKPLRRGE